ncbi:hypothetical protein ACHAXS_012459 [Conticribra weissflogii]
MTSKSGKGIDYSKWDRMDFSDDSSSEDDSGGDERPRPHVTSLDQPGRVTLRPDGTLEIGQSAQVAPSTNPPGVDNVESVTYRDADCAKSLLATTDNDEKCKKSKTKIQQLEEQYTRNGGTHNITVSIAATDPNYTPPTSNDDNDSDKSIQCPVYWNQDRHTVTLRIAFPPDVFPSRSIRVRVTGALKYVDRFAAVGSGGIPNNSYGEPSHGTLEVVSIPDNRNRSRNNFNNKINDCQTQQTNEILILKGHLPRPIHLLQDEEEIGFDIEDNPLGMDISSISEGKENVTQFLCSKFVVVTLPKAVPMEGLVLWWDCPLTSLPKLDVGSIRHRNVNLMKRGIDSGHAGMGYGKSGDGGSGKEDVSDNKKEAFEKAWEEAHAMFREKVKKKEVQYLSVDEESPTFVKT